MADPNRIYAETYDDSVSDWPDEFDFYLRLAREASGPTLELAAGTGRIAIRLAQSGVAVAGLDLSEDMLRVGRAKSVDLSNLDWVRADMRDFTLDRRFGLVIVPGHSFQNLLTADDQLACLRRAREHLLADGRLVVHLDHQDIDWLGDIAEGQPGSKVFEAAETTRDPRTGRQVRASRAWRYRRSDQTAFVTTAWEELDEDGSVITRTERGPLPIHCVFRYEMEHLLGRAGFAIEALYGDFAAGSLSEESSEMVFVSRPSAA